MEKLTAKYKEGDLFTKTNTRDGDTFKVTNVTYEQYGDITYELVGIRFGSVVDISESAIDNVYTFHPGCKVISMFDK